MTAVQSPLLPLVHSYSHGYNNGLNHGFLNGFYQGLAYSASAHLLYSQKTGHESVSALLDQKRQLLNEIEESFESNSYEGWDGYDALPASALSKEIAINVIEQLPLTIKKPNMVMNSMGGFSLEWVEDDKSLVIDIEGREISCSFINFKTKRKRNSYDENYDGTMPDVALLELRKEFSL